MCAVKPHVPTTSNAATSVTAQTSRAYHGRFAVQYNDQNGQQRNAYGNFDWQETGDTVTLQLRNPLGQTLAIVTSSPSSATLELPNRQPLTADNVSDADAEHARLRVAGRRPALLAAAIAGADLARARRRMDPHRPATGV